MRITEFKIFNPYKENSVLSLPVFSDYFLEDNKIESKIKNLTQIHQHAYDFLNKKQDEYFYQDRLYSSRFSEKEDLISKLIQSNEKSMTKISHLLENGFDFKRKYDFIFEEIYSLEDIKRICTLAKNPNSPSLYQLFWLKPYENQINEHGLKLDELGANKHIENIFYNKNLFNVNDHQFKPIIFYNLSQLGYALEVIPKLINEVLETVFSFKNISDNHSLTVFDLISAGILKTCRLNHQCPVGLKKYYTKKVDYIFEKNDINITQSMLENAEQLYSNSIDKIVKDLNLNIDLSFAAKSLYSNIENVIPLKRNLAFGIINYLSNEMGDDISLKMCKKFKLLPEILRNYTVQVKNELDKQMNENSN